MPPPLIQRIIIDTTGVRKAYAEAAGEARKYGKDSKQAAGQAQDGASRTAGALGRLGAIARTAIAGAAVSAVYALSRAINAASTTARIFERDMAQVATLVDTSSVSMRSLSKEVLALARDTAVPLDQMAPALYQAVSAGVDAGKAVEFLGVAARGSVAGASSLTDAVQGITAAMNGFGLEAEDAGAISDTLFVGVKRGVMTFGELSQQIGQVSGLANSANISLEETVAATAALTLSTNDAARAVTQLRGIVSKIVKPTEQGTAALEQMGVSLDAQTIKEKGFRQALQDVVTAAEKHGVALGTIFEDVEGLAGVLTLTGSQADSFGSIIEEMGRKSGATGDAYAKMAGTMEARTQVMKNRVGAAFAGIGQAINGVYMTLMDAAIPDSLAEIALKAGEAQQKIAALGTIERAIATVEDLGAKTALTADEQERLSAALGMIQEMFPGYISDVDSAGRAIGVYSNQLRAAIALQKQAALGQQGDQMRSLFEEFSRSRYSSGLWRGNQAAASRRVAEIQASPEFMHMQKALDDPRSVGSYMQRLASEYRSALSTMDTAGAKAADAESRFRNATRALTDLFNMAGGDRQVLIDALVGAGTSARDAAAMIDEVTAAYRRMEGFRPSQDYMGWMLPPEAAPSAPASTESGPTGLSAQIEALRARRDALVDAGVATAELGRVNRELFEKETELERLMDLGTKALREQAQAAEAARASFDRYSAAMREVRSTPEPQRVGRLGIDKPVGYDPANLPVIPPFLDDAKNKAAALRLEMERVAAAERKARDEARSFADSMRKVVVAGMNLADVGRELGVIDDSMMRVVDGGLRAVDALGALREANVAGPGGTADALGVLAAQAGIAAGVVSALSGIIGAFSSSGPNAEMVEAMRDNTRRIESAIFKLIEETRVAGDITQSQADSFYGAMLGALGKNPFSGGNGASTFGDFSSKLDALFASMEDAGGDTAELARGWRTQWDSMRGLIQAAMGDRPGSGSWNGARDLLDEFLAQIAETTGQMKFQLGEYNATTPTGIIAMIDFLREFGAIDAGGAFGQALDLLNGIATGDLASAIGQMRGLNPATDQEQIRTIIAQVAAAIAAGTFDFGSLTPNQIDDVLGALSRFASDAAQSPGDAGAEAEFTKSVQIARSITEVQTNELIALTETGVVRLEQIRDLLARMTPGSWEPSWLGGTPPGSGTSNVDVTIGPGVVLEAALPEILYRVEQRVREAIRSQP